MLNTIDKFLKITKESAPPTILVIGDSMIDETFHVKVIKLNPEFPTQCLLSPNDKPFNVAPGGAANLCYQSKNFSFLTYLFSVLDGYSEKTFKKHNINCDYSVMTDGSVPIKKRFYDGNFPLNRWDVEKDNYGDENINSKREKLYNHFLKFINCNRADVVILSDYDKGVFSEEFSRKIIQKCREKNIISIVDPKCTNLKKWENCSIFKPNTSYATKVCKSFNLKETDIKLDSQSKKLKEILGCEHVIITDSGNGVYLSETNEFITYSELSRRRPNIVNVSGAGDTFALFLAAAVSYKFTLKEAVCIAYNASTIYIQNRYNKPITRHELYSWVEPIESKIVSPNEITDNCKDKKIILTNGVYDAGLTMSHIECLQYAKEQGDILVVAINSDSSVKRLKGPSRPILSLKERMHIVAALQCVDYVVSFDEDTPLELIKKIKPHMVVKGGDYKPENVAGYGICEINIFPLQNYTSTTEKLKLLGLE